MKFVLSALIALAAAASVLGVRQQNFKKEVDFCKSKNPITDANVMNLHNTGVLLDESDEKARCFLECMMTRVDKFIDASGNFLTTVAKQTIVNHGFFYGPPGTAAPAQAVIDATVDQCMAAAASGEGKCMANYKMWTCLFATLHAKMNTTMTAAH